MATKKKKVELKKVIATVVIHGAAKMTEQGRRDLSNWLRRAGTHLEREGAHYSNSFMAKYFAK